MCIDGDERSCRSNCLRSMIVAENDTRRWRQREADVENTIQVLLVVIDELPSSSKILGGEVFLRSASAFLVPTFSLVKTGKVPSTTSLLI